MSIVGAFVLTFVVGVVSLSSRRIALLGMMLGVLYLTQGMSLNVGGINLFAFRFVELAAFARVLTRSEFKMTDMHSMDRLVFLLYIFTATIFVIRSSDDRAYQIGRSIDALLCYVAFRGLITEADDVRWLLRALIVLLIPYVLLLLIETTTRHNPFTILGGSHGSIWLRENRVRCNGSFRHPSLLGGMGACLLPLYVGLGFDRSQRGPAILGCLCCLAIVWASNSGGPASGVAAAMAGWALWPWRTHLRKVQAVILVLFLTAALLMKAPVWYLLARVSSITGGTGWHRSYLIDRAVNDLDRWWFMGMPIRDTAHWFPYVIAATGGADITNQFLVFGLTAGLGAMFLFIVVLVRAFREVGSMLKAVRSAPTRPVEPFFWGLGVAVLVHISTWLGISYFDQSYALWLLCLASVVGISNSNSTPNEELPAPLVSAGHS